MDPGWIYNIWVQWLKRNLDNIFQGQSSFLSCIILYLQCTSSDPAITAAPASENIILTISTKCKTNQPLISNSQGQEYVVVVIQTQNKKLYGIADYVDEFIGMAKQSNVILIVPVGEIVALAHLLWEYAKSDRIDNLRRANYHVD